MLLTHINVTILIAFWEIYAEHSLLSPRRSSNSIVNIRFNFRQQMVCFGVYRTFITRV